TPARPAAPPAGSMQQGRARRWMCGAEMMSATLMELDQRDRGGPQQPLLVVRNLRKYFAIRSGILGRVSAHVRAVDNVSFTVRKGEALGIVGESGCDKSTVARLLMRLIKPDAGEQIFDGDAVGEHGGI